MVQELLLVLSVTGAFFYLYKRFKPTNETNASGCNKNCGCDSAEEVL